MELASVAQKIDANKPTLFKRTFVFAGSFDPFAPHHRRIITDVLQPIKSSLLQQDPSLPVEIVIWPVGPYSAKQQVAPAAARKEMLFAGLGDVVHDIKVETHDLDYPGCGYTSTYSMQAQLANNPRTDWREEYLIVLSSPAVLTEIWHVIGADNVDGIRDWDQGSDLWKHGRFLILPREGYTPKKLPPHHEMLDPENLSGESTTIRDAIAKRQPWEHLVAPAVAAIIKRDKLYGYEKPFSISSLFRRNS